LSLSVGGAAGLLVPPWLTSCSPRSSQPGEPDYSATREVLDQRAACLDLRPSLDACAEPAELTEIQKRLNMIAYLVETYPVSPASEAKITETLSQVTIMQQENRIRWYLYSPPDSYGVYQRILFSCCIIVTCDRVSVILASEAGETG